MQQDQFNQQLALIEANLYNFAFSLAKEQEAAKDLFQETLLKAYKNRASYTVDTNFKAWIMTIMRNTFINLYRRKVKLRIVNDITDDYYYLNSSSVSIKNEGESNIFIKEVNSAIDQLDDTFKVPFILYSQGFKYREIAHRLDVPLGTVKSRIFFARKSLQQRVRV